MPINNRRKKQLKNKIKNKMKKINEMTNNQKTKMTNYNKK